MAKKDLKEIQSTINYEDRSHKKTRQTKSRINTTKKKATNRVTCKVNDKTLNIFVSFKTVDSSTIKSWDRQMGKIFDNYKIKDVVFDMELVEYVSSSVLRRLIALKNAGYNVTVINCSRQLYDIFAVVGFEKIIHIGTKRLQIKTNKMKEIATGGNGKIYDFSRDEILKIYYETISDERAEKGMQNAKKAFNRGLPVAIPYAMVETDQGKGIIYEKLKGKSLAHEMHTNPKYFRTGAIELVKLCQTLGSTYFEPGELSSVRETFINGLDPIKKFLPPHYVDAYNIAIESIPETNTAVHGDLHAGNVILEGNDLLLIDTDDFGSGHPIWDATSFYTAYYCLHEIGNETESMNLIGMTPKQAGKVWDIFTEEYFKGLSNKEKQRRLNAIKWYGAARTSKLYVDGFNITNMKDPTTQFVVGMVERYLEDSVMSHLYEMVSIFKTWKA